jgi:hypothetical protein
MSQSIESLLDQLGKDLEDMLEEAREQGRQEVLDHIQAFGGGKPVKKARPGRKPKAGAKPAKKKRKNPWASMTPEQREERVRKMLAGRGLKPKSKRKTKKKAAPKKKRKNPWASMTPAEKEARVKKMLAARGLKPKKKSK